MILVDACIIRSPGGWYIESLANMDRVLLTSDPRQAQVSRRSAEKTAEILALYDYVVDSTMLTPVPIAACCCGTDNWQTAKGRRATEGIVPVGHGQWRCPKHVGRVPCCIPGCGKTFAMKPADSYAEDYICGKHWRQAPKELRDRCAEIRKISKRKGWSQARIEMYERTWTEARDAVLEGGRLDEDEINKMFGWS